MVLADEGCIMYCLFSILKTKADIGGKIDYCRMCYIITFFLFFLSLIYGPAYYFYDVIFLLSPPQKTRGGC